MTKKEQKADPSGSSPNKNGWTDAIFIISGKDENGFQLIKLFGYDIRALIEDGEPWFMVQDLSNMFGIHPTTIPKRIENNPEDFEGWVLRRDVTSFRGNLPQSKNLTQIDLLVNEQAVYLIMGGMSTKRIKNPEAREMVRQFKRAFPDLMKMLRRGELQITSSEEWDYKRYLAAQGAKFLGDSIHSFIEYLARDPKHEPFVHMNNHKMINIIVFGRHVKGIRDTATKEELEAIHALELIDGTLIKSGMVNHKERKERLQAEYQLMKSKLLSSSSGALA